MSHNSVFLFVKISNAPKCLTRKIARLQQPNSTRVHATRPTTTKFFIAKSNRVAIRVFRNEIGGKTSIVCT